MNSFNIAGKEFVVNVLIKKLGQSHNKIHAIGHSLGGHMVGNIGKSTQDNGNYKIARITGKYGTYILTAFYSSIIS